MQRPSGEKELFFSLFFQNGPSKGLKLTEPQVLGTPANKKKHKKTPISFIGLSGGLFFITCLHSQWCTFILMRAGFHVTSMFCLCYLAIRLWTRSVSHKLSPHDFQPVMIHQVIGNLKRLCPSAWRTKYTEHSGGIIGGTQSNLLYLRCIYLNGVRARYSLTDRHSISKCCWSASRLTATEHEGGDQMTARHISCTFIILCVAQGTHHINM